MWFQLLRFMLRCGDKRIHVACIGTGEQGAVINISRTSSPQTRGYSGDQRQHLAAPPGRCQLQIPVRVHQLVPFDGTVTTILRGMLIAVRARERPGVIGTLLGISLACSAVILLTNPQQPAD